MIINEKQIISVTEANKNFSRATRVAEHYGKAVVFKNNRPRFLLVDIEKEPYFELTDDEKIDIAARRILEKYRTGFEELAK